MDIARETPTAINSNSLTSDPATYNIESPALGTNLKSNENPNEVSKPPGGDNSRADTDNQNDVTASTDNKNDSSSLSTAFTITFDDDINPSKKNFGIRDSIRKFAPPKPLTVEKPRAPKCDQSQDNSLVSVESAPAGFVRHSSQRERSTSSRASSRKSNSSRHSNISDSAAFLIDKMLNNKRAGDEKNLGQTTDRTKPLPNTGSPKTSSAKKIHPKKIGSSNDMIESEVDFWEDKSDNGTYIVGTDPESEAARKKIDELFGVVKAAEASLLAQSTSKMYKEQNPASIKKLARQSRPTDRKQPLSKERQEHIARLAYRKSPASRSSSSSRQENGSTNIRASSRHSRHSSCDRTPKAAGARPRRSTSQSSSHVEMSDGDTRSSRSSLQNGLDLSAQDNSLSSLPSMKFNRAFALRRARLGLDESPARITSTPNYVQDPDTTANLSSTYKRPGGSTSSKANSSTPGSFCREDGGRFSLRMKNFNQGAGNSRLNQAENAYHSKLSNLMKAGGSGYPSLSAQQQQLPRSFKPASTTLPYQSGDESTEAMSPYRYRMLANRLQRKRQPSEAETEIESYRMNFTLGQELEANSFSLGSDARVCSSAGRRNNNNSNPQLQLGALDSLVISAISSLSMKIRHSICDILIEQAKKLPVENETRLIVEEILPQLTADSLRCKSPTSIEEIDQSLYFDLAKTLKNLKKVEQMVDVINLISKDITTPTSPTSSSSTGISKITSTDVSNLQ